MKDDTPPSEIIALSELDDLSEEIVALRRQERRHLTWSLLGLSPAALIPAIGLLGDGSNALLILLVGLVTLREAFLWHRARTQADQLELKLETALLESETTGPGDDEPPTS